MKKVLLGTSALIAMGLAAPASAEITWKLTGDVTFQAGWADFDGQGDDRHYDFLTDANFNILADGQADNGLLYGAAIKLGADGNVDTNEAYVYVGGGWGRVTLGDDDSATNDLDTSVPNVGNWDGDFGSFAPTAYGAEGLNSLSDATKIKYTTDGLDLGGFKAGISFAPSASSFSDVDYNDTAVVVPTAPLGTSASVSSDEVALGANWSGAFGDFGVEVGSGLTFVNVDTAVVVVDPNNPGTNIVVSDDENVVSWNLGANVTYGALAAGLQYVNNDDLSDSHGLNFGVTYAIDAWTFGAGWAHVFGDNDADADTFGVGVAYAVAPGLSVQADLTHFDDDAGLGDDDGTVLILETSVEF